MAKDWIPTGLKEFDDFQKNFMDECGTNASTWHLDSTQFTALQGKQTPYGTAYAITKNKSTASQDERDDTDTKRGVFKKGIRIFTNAQIRYNANMSDANRTSINVPNPSGTHTDSPVETNGPAIWFDNSHHGLLFIHCAPFGSTKEHKPAGQHEVVLFYEFYKIGDPIPALNACTHHTTSTDLPAHLDTTEDQFGKMMVCYGYWKNNVGKLSPPTTAFSVLIT